MSTGERRPDASAARRLSMARGAATLFASSMLRQGLGIATLVVTARLLTPEDFGIAAYVFIAALVLEMLQRQCTLPLVRLETVMRDHLDTIFTVQLLIGVTLACVTYLLAAPIAALLGVPRLTEVMPLIAGLALLLAFRSPAFLLFERDLAFGPAATETVLGQASYSVLAIGLAAVWHDFWALLVATAVQIGARGGFTFYMAPILPRLGLARWRDLLGFWGWAMGASSLQLAADRLPQLMIGGALGLTEAGIFRVGNRISTLVTKNVASPMSRVFYPGLAEATRAGGGESPAFARLNATVLAVVLPLGVGAALVADDLVRIALGPEWIAAAQVVVLLAPLRGLETLQASMRAATLVEGNPKLLFLRNAAFLTIVAAAMWIGTRYGFTGALVGAAVSSLAGFATTLGVSYRYGSGRLLEPLLVAWRSIIACAAMAAAVYGVSQGVGDSIPLAWKIVAIVGEVCIGAVVYGAVHLLLWQWRGRPVGFETSLLEILQRRRARTVDRRA